MHRFVLLTFLVGLVTVGQAQEPAKTQPPKIHRDLVFGKGGDKELKLDLAVPPGKGPFPTLVLIHGGGWKGGSYKDALVQMIMMRFVAQGYAAASVQYRLTPTKARFPSQIEDCKCAIRWLRANANTYQLDPKRFGAMGGSAGAHLALLIGLTTKADGLEGTGDLQPTFAQQDSGVLAVVNLFGPTDLVHGNWDKKVEPLLEELLGGPVAEHEALAKQGSPLTYIRPGSKLPPILTFHGTKDQVVPYEHATKLHAALDRVQSPGQLVTMEGDGHGWMGTKLDQTIKQSEEFFRQHLNKD